MAHKGRRSLPRLRSSGHNWTRSLCCWCAWQYLARRNSQIPAYRRSIPHVSHSTRWNVPFYQLSKLLLRMYVYADKGSSGLAGHWRHWHWCLMSASSHSTHSCHSHLCCLWSSRSLPCFPAHGAGISGTSLDSAPSTPDAMPLSHMYSRCGEVILSVLCPPWCVATNKSELRYAGNQQSEHRACWLTKCTQNTQGPSTRMSRASACLLTANGRLINSATRPH